MVETYQGRTTRGFRRRFLLERVLKTALVVAVLVLMVVALAEGSVARALLLLLLAVSAGVSALFPGTGHTSAERIGHPGGAAAGTQLSGPAASDRVVRLPGDGAK